MEDAPFFKIIKARDLKNVLLNDYKDYKNGCIEGDIEFYKITNKDEIHGNMQYTDGWNEDILPFHPQNSCEKGGLYFVFKRDVGAWINYIVKKTFNPPILENGEYVISKFVEVNGKWVRKVSLDDDEDVYIEFDSSSQTPFKFKVHKIHLGPRIAIKDFLNQK